jgi:hypothetical protein
VAGTLAGAIEQNSRRRRERAERKASEMPPEVVKCHNLCISLLAELPPQAALAVTERIARGIREFLATQA